MTNPIIMMAGLPGTSKSTIAKKLEDNLDYDLHSLIGVRQDLGYKRYTPKQNVTVFDELYRRTRDSLMQKRGVILDSTYTNQEGRKTVYDIAQEYGLDVLIIEPHCYEKESKRRMKSRPPNKGLIVEPRDPKVYDKLAKRWQSIAWDIEDFSNVPIIYPISYIRYDSENNSFEEINVLERMRPLIETIKKIIL